VTEHPNQEWTTQQIREAFPWDQAPKYLLRDRDSIYGKDFAAITTGMGIEEVITAPRSPWQNPYVERLVGSIRRECLDHFIVWNQRSLRRTLQSYFAYYERCRTHLSLEKGAPVSRPVEPFSLGHVIKIPKSAACITFTRAKLPDRSGLPNARVKMQNDPFARFSCEV
jgi:putative transposase